MRPPAKVHHVSEEPSNWKGSLRRKSSPTADHRGQRGLTASDGVAAREREPFRVLTSPLDYSRRRREHSAAASALPSTTPSCPEASCPRRVTIHVESAKSLVATAAFRRQIPRQRRTPGGGRPASGTSIASMPLDRRIRGGLQAADVAARARVARRRGTRRALSLAQVLKWLRLLASREPQPRNPYRPTAHWCPPPATARLTTSRSSRTPSNGNYGSGSNCGHVARRENRRGVPAGASQAGA